MTSNYHLLYTMQTFYGEYIVMGITRALACTDTGEATTHVKNQSHRILGNIYFVPISPCKSGCACKDVNIDIGNDSHTGHVHASPWLYTETLSTFRGLMSARKI